MELFPDYQEETSSKEMHKPDYRVGQELTLLNERKAIFIAQYKCGDGVVKYRVLNENSKLEMVNQDNINHGKSIIQRKGVRPPS